MSNDDKPKVTNKQVFAVVIVIAVFIFLFYLVGSALEGVANGMESIPKWLLIPLFFATIYVVRQMIEGKK